MRFVFIVYQIEGYQNILEGESPIFFLEGESPILNEISDDCFK